MGCLEHGSWAELQVVIGMRGNKLLGLTVNHKSRLDQWLGWSNFMAPPLYIEGWQTILMVEHLGDFVPSFCAVF